MDKHIMDRRRFVKTAAVAGAAALSFPAVLRGAAARRRPNVLFISVDDMNCDGAFCGGPAASTPCLDALASRGVVFARNYCQYPLCSPSRSSLMTGLRPDRTRVFGNAYHFRTEIPDVVTIPQMFMREGYYSARVGKIYHYNNPDQMGTNGLDDAPSWQHVVNPLGRDKSLLAETPNFTPSHKWGSAIGAFADKNGRDEDYTDGKVATEAIALLEQKRNDPFFLAVGFFKPHTPYIVPQKYFDLHPLEKIEIPSMPENYRKTIPKAALESNRPWPNFGITPEQARLAKQGYYAAISFVDAQIGRVLTALDRLGLRDNTIVVFWSDHGYHVGDHGLWFKRSCFEGAARVPLVIAPPRAAGAGRRCTRIVEHVDIYPTLADLAGITPPAGLAGVSLRPLIENPAAPWDRPAFTQVERRGGFAGCSIRTERWRFTQWDQGRQGEELYDHESDPHEMRNLIDESKHERVIAELRERVRAHWPRHVEGGQAERVS